MIVLYGITLRPMAEDPRAKNLVLLSPFYADNAAFDELERRSAQILKLLMERGMYRRYFQQAGQVAFYCGFD